MIKDLKHRLNRHNEESKGVFFMFLMLVLIASMGLVSFIDNL
jgi:hypothetical protein